MIAKEIKDSAGFCSKWSLLVIDNTRKLRTDKVRQLATGHKKAADVSPFRFYVPVDGADTGNVVRVTNVVRQQSVANLHANMVGFWRL